MSDSLLLHISARAMLTGYLRTHVRTQTDYAVMFMIAAMLGGLFGNTLVL